MSDVKRYELSSLHHQLRENVDGYWIPHETYLALKQERDELRDVLSLMLADVESYKANPGGHAPLHHVASARNALEKARQS